MDVAIYKSTVFYDNLGQADMCLRLSNGSLLKLCEHISTSMVTRLDKNNTEAPYER